MDLTGTQLADIIAAVSLAAFFGAVFKAKIDGGFKVP